MTELSNFLGRPVILLNDCGVLGTVGDVLFDSKCKKIEYFVIKCNFENDGECHAPLAAAYGDILGFSDALTLADRVGVVSVSDLDLTSYASEMFQKPVYSRNGAFKGLIREIICGDKGKVRSFATETAKYKPDDFDGIGEIAILRGEKQPRAKKKMPRPEEDAKVTLLYSPDGEISDARVLSDQSELNAANSDNSENAAYSAREAASYQEHSDGANGKKDGENLKSDVGESKINIENLKSDIGDLKDNGEDLKSHDEDLKTATNKLSKENNFLSGEKLSAEPESLKQIMDMIEAASVAAGEDDAHIPSRIICGYDFLLGRVLGADLNTYTGAPIAPAGTPVTAELVEKARRAGKLVELTLSSKKES